MEVTSEVGGGNGTGDPASASSRLRLNGCWRTAMQRVTQPCSLAASRRRAAGMGSVNSVLLCRVALVH